MKILNKFTYRNLIKNKKRTIVTIIGTILATALIFLVGLLFSSIREQELNNSILRYGDHHAIISNPSNDEKIDKIISNHDTVSKYIKIDIVETGEYEVINASFNYEDNFKLASGVLPSNKNEVIISYDYIKSIEYKLNDEIIINDNSYKIVGIYNESKFDGYIHQDGYRDDTKNKFYTKTLDNYPTDFYLYYKDMKKTVENTYQIAIDCGYNRVMTSSYTDVHKYENIKINLEYLKWFGVGHADYQNRITTILVVVLSFLALFSALAIYNAFSISVSERKKLFGIFRSIGASKFNIFLSVLFEAFIIAIISIPLGLILSLIILGLGSNLIESLLSNVDTFYNLKIVIYPSYLFISLVLAILMVFISALVPAIKSCFVSPIEALRLNKDVKLKKKNSSFKIGLFGIEKALAKKNITRDARKFRSAKLSIIISVVLIMVFGVLVNQLVSSLERTIDYGKYPISIYVNVSENSEDIIDEIISLDEVDDYLVQRFIFTSTLAENGYFTDSYLNKRGNDDGIEYLNIVSYDKKNYDALKEKYNVKDNVTFVNKNYIEKSNQAYIDDLVIEKYNDNLTSLKLYIRGTKDFFYELTNIHLIDDKTYDGADIVILDEELEKINKSYEAVLQDKDSYYGGESYYIFINADDFKGIDGKLVNITKKYDEVENYSNSLMEDYNNIMTVKIFIFAVYMFMGFIVLIAATNVFNTINTNINLRKREFSILRSIGLSKTSFNKMILYEGLVLGLDSLIYGHLISGIFYFLLMFSNLFGEEILPYPFNFLIITIIGTYLIIFISLYLATKKVKKSNIIETIRNDNI